MLTRLASFQVALDWTFLENGDPTGSASSDVAILAWLTPMAAFLPVSCKRYAMDRTALSHNEFVYGLFKTLWRESGGDSCRFVAFSRS